LPRPACVKYLSSFVPRKTFVSRPKVGNPMGAEPPWSSGRDSQGNRLEIGSLGRAFAFFRRAAKEGRSRRSETTLVQTLVPAAAGNPPSLCGFAVCLCDLVSWPVASGGPISLTAKKSAKETAKGNLSRRRFPLESFPIGQGAAAPLRSPGDYEDERRKFGREERIATPAARVRNDGGTMDGRRGTRDEGRKVWSVFT